MTVFHVDAVWIVVAPDRTVVAVHAMEREAQKQADREGFTVERWPLEQTPYAVAWARVTA